MLGKYGSVDTQCFLVVLLILKTEIRIKKKILKKFLNVKLITQSVIVALWSVPEIPATEHNFVILEYSLLDQK